MLTDAGKPFSMEGHKTLQIYPSSNPRNSAYTLESITATHLVIAGNGWCDYCLSLYDERLYGYDGWKDYLLEPGGRVVHALYDFTICLFTTMYRYYGQLKAVTDVRNYLIDSYFTYLSNLHSSHVDM